MRRFVLLGLAVLYVLGRAVMGGAASTAGCAQRAAPPSYWEAVIQGKIRPG